MASYRTRVTEGGRLVIPAEIRRQLGLQPGAEVVLDVTNEELRIRSVRQAIENAQLLVRRYVTSSTSLADELISERHEAARRE
jgi:AbrB family looped-hinge helix DNA binding protein